ncbi:MAG TPA: nuclear transport factor 2 family protein [Cyclobacteriaceae bacterium]|nr:nuclear transport factor 2 family protein [Cyclobacteriaceae bacterium]
MTIRYALLIVASFIILTSFRTSTVNFEAPTTLYDSIASLDARWEDAYNNCKLDVMEELISEDLEFYHDQGGLLTSKTELNQALKNNICGKVSRRLKPGSIEVYEIRNFGAVEMGMHGFINSQEPKPTQMHYAKFVHIWKRQSGGKWQITRVISLH